MLRVPGVPVNSPDIISTSLAFKSDVNNVNVIPSNTSSTKVVQYMC